MNPTPSVAIIGGGLAGIAAAVNLANRGIRDFVIFERAAGPGGTWWHNRYPGAEVDVTSQLYSYSFHAHDWTRTHARQPELQDYIQSVVDRFGLVDHFRFGSTVDEVAWDDGRCGYTVRTLKGQSAFFRAVVSAVGMLSAPRYPELAGRDQFTGTALHTAAWQPIDLQGKRVAIMGTGSSAAQVIPAIADSAAHVKVFQREPGWVLPKPDRDLNADERAALRRGWRRRRARVRAWWAVERDQVFGAMHRPGSTANARREAQCRDYIAATFADRPDLAAAVTPAYAFAGKRPVLSKDYYPALLRDDVELIPHSVTAMTHNGVIDQRGIAHDADIVVFATGFRPAQYLESLRVLGRGGRALHDFWAGEPRAFAGVTVPGFPNFYILYGPNTNGGEIISALERQAHYAARSIARLRGDVRSIEVRPWFFRAYNTWLDRAIRKTVWVGARNYYKAPSGRVVTQWPYGITVYTAVLKLLGRVSEKISRGSRGAIDQQNPPLQEAQSCTIS